MYIIIKTSTNSNEVCNKITNKVLKNKLSPCTQVYLTTSKYKWDNKINKNNEYIIEIKSIKKYQEEIYSIIKDIHNYDIPEIISIDINILNKNYKDWFDENL